MYIVYGGKFPRTLMVEIVMADFRIATGMAKRTRPRSRLGRSTRAGTACG